MSPRRLILAATLAAVVPAAAHAQRAQRPHAADAGRCGPAASWAAAAVGPSRYDVGGGTGAVEAGADVGLRLGAGPRAAAVRVGYRKVLPESGDADPDVLRLTATLPVARVAGIGLCAVGHAGGSRFPSDGDDATVVAGGLGLRLERPFAEGRLLPFVELRGLAASLSGTALGLDVDASGVSVGGEGGLEGVVGRLVLRAAVSADGFDGGLGVTPYPALLLQLGAGFRF